MNLNSRVSLCCNLVLNFEGRAAGVAGAGDLWAVLDLSEVRLGSYLSSVRFEIWKYLADTADEDGPLPQWEKVTGAGAV